MQIYLQYELSVLSGNDFQTATRKQFKIVAKDVENISLRATKNKIVKKAIELEESITGLNIVNGDKKIYNDCKKFIYKSIEFVTEINVKNLCRDEELIEVETVLKKNK